MKVEIEERDGVRVIGVQEPILDINNISDFRDLLEEKAQEHDGPVVLDFSGTNYLGSVGLGMVSLTSIMLQDEGRGFAVVVRTPEIKRLFDISGLRKVIRVEEEVDAAVAALATTSGAAA